MEEFGSPSSRCARRSAPGTGTDRIEGGLPLLTLNRRDFADFDEHDGLMLLG